MFMNPAYEKTFSNFTRAICYIGIYGKLPFPQNQNGQTCADNYLYQKFTSTVQSTSGGYYSNPRSKPDFQCLARYGILNPIDLDR